MDRPDSSAPTSLAHRNRSYRRDDTSATASVTATSDSASTAQPLGATHASAYPAAPRMRKSYGRSGSSPTHRSTPSSNEHRSRRRERIIVPQLLINGGIDVEFDPDPENIDLYDIMSEQEYEDAITVLNGLLRDCRSTKVDKFLVATSPLVVPLAILGHRKKRRTRRRLLLLHEGIIFFNEAYPAQRMKWNRTSEGDFLSIEARTPADVRPLLTGLEFLTLR